MLRSSLLLILLMVISPRFAAGGQFYVSPEGGATKAGTKADPFTTAELNNTFWASLETGGPHTIYFFGGNYTNATFQIRHASPEPLFLKPGSAAPDPSGIDGQVLFVQMTTDSYIVDLGNGGGASTAARNVTIDGETTPGAGTINWKFIIGNNHCFTYEGTGANYSSNKFRFLELGNMTDDVNDGSGETRKVFDSASYTDGTIIEHCYFHDNNGHSDIQASALTGAWGAVEVGNNLFSNVTANVLSGGHGTDFHHNTVNGDGSALPYDIIHFYGGVGDRIEFLRVWNNFIRNDEQMIFLENHTGIGIREVRIWNNVFGNATPGAGKPIMFEDNDTVSNTNILVANNVFSGTGFGVRMYNVNPTTWWGLKIVNNLFTGVVGSEIMFQNALSENTINTWNPDSEGVFDHNLIHRVGGGISVVWKAATAGTVATYTSFSGDWISHHADWSNNIASNPGFASGTYRPTNGSQAITAGMDLSAFFTTDFDDNPRSVPWDIGVFEYSSSPAPDVPKTLRANSVRAGIIRGR